MLTSGPCFSSSHLSRRTLLQKTAAGVGLAWLTPIAEQLARAEEAAPKGSPAKSVIVLWMEGGPSQLETFDPHPETEIGGRDPMSAVKAIDTAVKEIQIGEHYPRVAEQMEHISLIRSVVSKEGDHERGTYTMKNGWVPDPTLIHPSLGAILCHETTDNIEIPRHVSIYPNQWSARGGYLGDNYDAFRIHDPNRPVPDVVAAVGKERNDRRMADLINIVEPQFSRRRLKDLDTKRTLHKPSVEAASKMMTSDQLKAFDISQAPKELQEEFGDSQFGRGCLAAMQLIEVGVRAVEINLGTWDSHVNNYETCKARAAALDPAYAALIKNLRERGLLENTLVVWMGEFGRTPRINGLGGRDHWPHGFTIALSGCGIAGGRVIGSTSPEPKLDEKNRLQDVEDPQDVAAVHATMLEALGINFKSEHLTPIGRPMVYSKGTPIQRLFG
jgi:hypothetical protein